MLLDHTKREQSLLRCFYRWAPG